jgi:hypothetical protein
MWGDVPRQEAAHQLERARAEWIEVRGHHAIGSPREAAAWELYRSASDRIMEMHRAARISR